MGSCGSMNIVSVMQDEKGLEMCYTIVRRQYQLVILDYTLKNVSRG